MKKKNAVKEERYTVKSTIAQLLNLNLAQTLNHEVVLSNDKLVWHLRLIYGLLFIKK